MYIMARMCLYGKIRPGRISLGSYRVCIVLYVHFGKAEAAYRHPQISNHDAGVVYFTEYLSVLFHDQLTYLDELNGECNGTARACVNSGYQALFSPITEHLGTRLVLYTRPDACHKGTHSALHTGGYGCGGGTGRVWLCVV